MVRHHLYGHAEIKHTTMTFDFDKAIKGDPIYCQGLAIQSIVYSPSNQTFTDSYSTWDRNGKLISNTYKAYDLYTDPPKKKVKKLVKVRLYQTEYGDIMATTRGDLPHEFILKEFEVEIEVESL